MTREQQIAISILQYVGGKENITRVAHCMTRVRVSLRDPGKANMDALTQIEGVMGVIEDETLQIVVGPGVVNKVAAALCELAGLELGEVIEDGMEDIAERTKAEVKARQQTPLKRLLRKIGSIFIPLIPGLVASGIINGIANFAKNAGVDPQTTWLQLLLLIGGGIFASLGVLVGYNTAKEFGGTPVLGAIAGILVFNPALADIKLFWEALTPGGEDCLPFCLPLGSWRRSKNGCVRLCRIRSTLLSRRSLPY